jgi:hypothetical protein
MTKHARHRSARPTIAELLARIDAFLNRTGISETRLGKEVMGDTSLVYRIRNGGDVYTGTVDAIDHYMHDYLRRKEDLPPAPSQDTARRGRGRRMARVA